MTSRAELAACLINRVKSRQRRALLMERAFAQLAWETRIKLCRKQLKKLPRETFEGGTFVPLWFPRKDVS